MGRCNFYSLLSYKSHAFIVRNGQIPYSILYSNVDIFLYSLGYLIVFYSWYEYTKLDPRDCNCVFCTQQLSTTTDDIVMMQINFWYLQNVTFFESKLYFSYESSPISDSSTLESKDEFTFLLISRTQIFVDLWLSSADLESLSLRYGETLHHNQCSTFVTVTIADTAPPSLDPTAMVNMRSLLVILIYQLLFQKEHEVALLIQYINLFLMLIYLSHTNILSLHWIFTLF